MAKITAEYYKECYKSGKRIVEGSLSIGMANKNIYEMGMSYNSVPHYLRCVRAMLVGERFTATISESALTYFLSQIHEEYGEEGLRKALSSVRQYLEYQKDKNSLPGSRKIYEEFLGKL